VGWLVVARSGDLEEGKMLGINVNGLRVALYRLSGVVYATGDVCSHAYALLSTGYLDGDCVECPLHQALFHIPTGEARTAPATDPIKTYPAREDGESISVDLSGS
jgi:nitrite reductase/ring-hydroxylating ferredoxin subunit